VSYLDRVVSGALLGCRRCVCRCLLANTAARVFIPLQVRCWLLTFGFVCIPSDNVDCSQEHPVIAVRIKVTALAETTLRCILAKTGSSNVTRLIIRSLGSYEYEAIMLTVG
jgi:hypothetical protein